MRAGSFDEKERRQKLQAKAAASRAGSPWTEVVGGGVGALGAGMASGWNPALMAAGYQGGAAITDSLTGDDMKPEDVKGAMSAGTSALSELDDLAKNKLVAEKQAEMSKLIKHFMASRG